MDTAQDHGIFFSSNVHQRNIVFSVVHVQACLKSHPFIIVFLSCQARVAANSTNRTCASGWLVLPVGLCFRLVCASGWFVLPVGLNEWKIVTTHPILTIKFESILRTSFKAEIFKIFKNNVPQPKN